MTGSMTTKGLVIATAAPLFVGGGAITSARADSTQATREVRKDGKVQKESSGACTFSQRQGYVDLTLANGFAISLSPTGSPNHFKDAKGHKVVRQLQGETQLYKWRDGDEKTIAVSFGARASGGHE